MYLDEMIETLTILRDNRKLMGSARVFSDGFEVTAIESNGFDIKLVTTNAYNTVDAVSSIDEHVRETNAAIEGYERRTNNGNQENDEKNA